MKTITLKLQIEPEIYEATTQFMEEKGIKIEQELELSVRKNYMKYVPAAVRKYIEKSLKIPAPFIAPLPSDSTLRENQGEDSQEKSSQNESL